MKVHILFLALAFQFAFIAGNIGQSKSISKASLTKQFSSYKNTDANLDHRNFFEMMSQKMHLSNQSEMVPLETIQGKNGYVHYKFKQLHNGVPVFGNTYILHEKDGKLLTATGRYSPDIRQNTKPSMNAETAQAMAKQAMKASQYAKQNPQPVLCLIDPTFPNTSESLLLAYQVDLKSTEPFDKQRIFIDAHSGKTICHFPLILHEGVPSTGKTRYYGTQNITTDSIGPQLFHLHDPTRGEGITVGNVDGTAFTSQSSNWDLTNPHQDEVALDVLYCAEKYYDLMDSQFNWQGLDGNGKALKAAVHLDEVNAYWDGDGTSFGDGDCIYGPLTTLEVVGHEFTHGMIDYTSNLVYSSESGAMNESLADMFGKILERNIDPTHFDWDLGHTFLLTPEAEPFRVMDDPASIGMPDFYKGSLWSDGADVHTNSSIGNLWFSMIVDGRQGTNEIGETYNVPALGIDKAGQLVFLVNNAYLTESSNYPAFFDYSIQAAEALYGPGSPEAAAVEEAWNAVGLPGDATGPSLDLGILATYEISNVCGLNQYYPVTVQVSNQGTQDYDPAMGASVTLSTFSGTIPDYNVPIDITLAPGEVFTLVVDNWFFADAPDYAFMNMDLDFSDDNFDNNYGWAAFNIVPYVSDDMEMSVYFGAYTCFSPEIETEVYLNNNSCETIPAGTTMTIQAKDANGTVVWSTPYVLPVDLEGFGYSFNTYQLDLTNLAGADTVYFSLDYLADPDPINNNASSPLTVLETIDGDYLNNFNQDVTLDNSLEFEYFVDDPLVNYQGDKYFGSTGWNNDPESFAHCPDYTTIFNGDFGNGGINATVRACVDFSAYSDPYMDFDLVQFRNNFAEADNYLYSSMFQSKWTGTEEGSDIIFDQTEGQEEHHVYQLPANFVGEVHFKLYTEAGQFQLLSENFDTDDFMLLDNLRFRTSFTGTNEPKKNELVQASPNPTQGNVLLRSTETILSVVVQNLNGQVLGEFKANSPVYELDMSEFKNGFYFLSIQLENGQLSVQKVVKIE